MVKAAKYCVLDSIGSALGAVRYEEIPELCRELRQWCAAPAGRTASVWGQGFSLDVFQALLLNGMMGHALELDDVAVETLRKGRNTQAQSGLDDDAARRANVLGAYTIVDPELVEGKRVLLIDDVITTGSTISECARVLRSAGAADVVCATLARARGEKT